MNPNKFRDEVISTWNTRVSGRVVVGQKHELTGPLRAYVEGYSFTSFRYATLDEILDDHRRTAYWAARFNGALPPAPAGVAPQAVAPGETVYVGKLLDVYSEESGIALRSPDDLMAHPNWRENLQKQRVRFYDAEAFMAHYRDQTEPGTIEDFADQIFDAIDPAVAATVGAHPRLTAALSVAGQAMPASVLAPRAKVRVKQGVCHQLANDDRLTWKL